MWNSYSYIHQPRTTFSSNPHLVEEATCFPFFTPLHGSLRNNFMAPFYGWGSTASMLEPLWGGSLLFTTKFPEIPGTHYQPQKDERLSWPWSHPVVLNTGPLDWESSTLTTRPLLHCRRKKDMTLKLYPLIQYK